MKFFASTLCVLLASAVHGQTDKNVACQNSIEDDAGASKNYDDNKSDCAQSTTYELGGTTTDCTKATTTDQAACKAQAIVLCHAEKGVDYCNFVKKNTDCTAASNWVLTRDQDFSCATIESQQCTEALEEFSKNNAKDMSGFGQATNDCSATKDAKYTALCASEKVPASCVGPVCIFDKVPTFKNFVKKQIEEKGKCCDANSEYNMFCTAYKTLTAAETEEDTTKEDNSNASAVALSAAAVLGAALAM